MKEETIKYIEYLMADLYFRNPSAIASCILMKGFEKEEIYKQDYVYPSLRKRVIKEMDRIKKKLDLKFEMPKE